MKNIQVCYSNLAITVIFIYVALLMPEKEEVALFLYGNEWRWER